MRDQLIETTPFSFYKVFDINGNMVYEQTNSTKALTKALELLLSDGKVKVHHGPGLLWDFDIEKSLDPKGEYHTDKIPPFFWETLDNETREKLK